jgi:hypothetical protein
MVKLQPVELNVPDVAVLRSNERLEQAASTVASTTDDTQRASRTRSRTRGRVGEGTREPSALDRRLLANASGRMVENIPKPAAR